MKFDNYTKEEIEELTAWVIKMVKFWGLSALLYVTVFYANTLTAWILGSIVVLYAADYWYGAKERDFEDDKDNRH